MVFVSKQNICSNRGDKSRVEFMFLIKTNTEVISSSGSEQHFHGWYRFLLLVLTAAVVVYPLVLPAFGVVS